MAELSTPVREAVERLGEAAQDVVADAVVRCTAYAAAVGAAADPATSASVKVADDMARSALASWVGSMRAVAVTAVAVTDAAAILSRPPSLVEYYAIDLADHLPGRVLPVKLSLVSVAWWNTNDTGDLPTVSITTAQPIGPPPGIGRDEIRFRAYPSPKAKALRATVLVEVDVSATVSATVTATVAPMVLELRLSSTFSVDGP